MKKFLILFSCLFTISISFSFSKEKQFSLKELKKKAPKIFIDCKRCDINFIREEITFVNYVWDPKEAQIHILITTQRTGGGGREYSINFIGKDVYTGMEDTLKFVSKQFDSEDDIRRGIVHTLKMGLMPYIAKTPLANYISISFTEEVEPTAVEDKWNFWVFRISARGRINGEKSRSYTSIHGSFSANRITPQLKIRLSVSGNFDKSKFTIDDTIISTSSEREGFYGLIVKSINDHWSVGATFNISSSTYRNIKLSIQPFPAIEYNLFPYSISTRRQLRFLYSFGYEFFRYFEETIYYKISERLLKEVLSISLEITEPWGSAEARVVGSHYFHDFSKNRVEFSGQFSLRLFKGLSVDIFGRFSMIHDQLSLPKGGATIEEILLRRKELATTYDYSLSLGLSYTFGSIFSNVVNPRFGY